MSKQEQKPGKEKIWIDITPKHGIWKPENPGDEITGTLLQTTPAPYKGRPNTKYCLQTQHPEAINNKIMIYGTYCLNKTLQNPELIGKTIKITYKGTTPSSDPMKKPFKKYKIQLQLHPNDPLYKKYTQNTITTNTLNPTDNTQIKEIIQTYTEIYQKENQNKTPTPEDIIKLATTDPDLTNTQLTQIKHTLATQIQRDQQL